MMNKFIYFCIIVLQVPIYLMASVIPKNPKLWVFGAWFGKKFSDNPRAVFDYIERSGHDIDKLWIVNDQSLLDDLQAKGIHALKSTSIAGMWYQARAGAAIYTHSVQTEFCSLCITGRTKKIFLWHGTPLKHIGSDGYRGTTSPFNMVIKNTFFRFLVTRVDLMCAPSENIAEIFSRVFSVPRSRVAITGEAKSDLVIESCRTIKSSDDSLSILYAPTLRKVAWTEFDFFGDFIDNVKDLDACLKQNEIELAIRLHPANHPSDETVLKVNAAKNIFFENTDELNDVLWKYDALITDFSGVMFDFSLLKRPVYFLALDVEDYLKNERELYVDYEEFIAGSKITNWYSLLNQIPKIVGHIKHGTYTINRKISDHGVHFYDGESSKRVYQEITKLF